MRAFGCWFIAPQVNLLYVVPSVIWDLSGIPLGIGQRLFGICVHGAGGAVFFVPPAPEFVHRVLADFAERKQSSSCTVFHVRVAKLCGRLCRDRMS